MAEVVGGQRQACEWLLQQLAVEVLLRNAIP